MSGEERESHASLFVRLDEVRVASFGVINLSAIHTTVTI